ncbi:telomerase reverse transcriptase-like isoform X2 [Ceratina calcarata]|uniref:Telomerase reverse transcriptase n=1 Tax=Ceratina calcarata TaxID=156304 RepID=A0AAJ7S4F6_9HYME|nr:telomerase reverse transcriptase-like isoform X2 [Ceratina calcarata]XP_026670743.1 telomerase reverse transcriptase-like isoform X2 [Ceratina calcarata]
MDRSTAQSLREAHGSEFQRYCLKNRIKIQRDANDCFLVSEEADVKHCLQLKKEYKKKIDLKLKKLQHSKPRQKFNTSNPVSATRKIDETCETIFPKDLSVSVRLYSSPLGFPSYKNNSLACMLDECRSGNEFYEHIIKETRKDIVIVDYEISIPLISSLLEDFKKRHEKFHYTSVLSHVAHENKCKQQANPICQYAITREKLIYFLELVFSKVVPLEIFGKLRNLKKIKHTMIRLLNLPHFKLLNVKTVVSKLDIACIKWVSGIENVKTKWLILLKFIRWFFIGFLFKVIYQNFHITIHNNTERLFIIRSDWNRIQRNFLQKKMRTNALKVNNVSSSCLPIGIYKLIPKFSNVRPILKTEKSKEFVQQKTLIMNFLKQLYVTKFGVNDFEKKWKSVVESRRNKKTYMVYCDVVDAFGSIIQELLFEMVRWLSKDLPEKLTLKMYAVKSRQQTRITTCYKQYCCHPDLALPFAPGTFYSVSGGSSWVRKSMLIENISKCIFEQLIKIKGKTYTLRKGVAQGAVLSPILSDIYYSFILNEELAVFSREGELLKYVDDILYLTDNEDFAKQFLEVTKRGLPRYNCYFKQAKTQTNVPYDGRAAADSILYIGYKIDCLSLGLEPNYTEIKFTYSMYSKKMSDPIQILDSRLKNFTVLKLRKIVLQDTIKKQNILFSILERSFSVQAKRARYLLIQLFGSRVQENVTTIFDIIKYTNELIARFVIRTLDRKTHNI